MQVLTTPQAPTLFEMDLERDFSPLDEALEAARPYGCKSIEFIDDNRKRGYRALEYKVQVVAGHEHDEDGWSPKYEPHTISVGVRSRMSIDSIVFLLLGEINHLIAS
ncbi:hypothetical protein [Spirosoma radiotolerans]|uniref:Uncharacterized protein n=1 Tax=Spirosoma radiotolerans TaxID=1379870 RepID=A0A0E3ZVD2_9BACT|nr:hypothetical protein [Spirosoma radiotolerans]AKD55059.1 hypothetical protein SD10_09210 [Spirosoma radiotolerans]